MSRRKFLQRLGIAGAAGVATGSLISTRAAFASTPTWDGPILIVLSLRGGFDGLSAVAPIGDPDYATKRPGIAIPSGTALPTGDRMFGLHPSFAPLKPMWDARTMAAVHAVGTPDQTRSHFSATAELEQAAPGSSLRTGWLDRVLGAAGTGTVFEAVQLGSGKPAGLLAGDAPVMSTYRLTDFTLDSLDWVGARMTNTLHALHSNTTLPMAAPALLTLAALDTTAAVVAGHPGPANGASYPANSDLGKALSDAAALIRGNVGVQAITVDVGNWDMHENLGSAGTGWMADNLSDVANSIAAFATDVGPAVMSKVTIVTLSEFGRRVEQNGSGGVDHGHGNVVLLVGGGLAGGQVHGTWPTLADDALDDGDLAGTTDYRDVLSECLSKRFGLSQSDLSAVFPGFTPTFPGAFS
jgi:uncharacterized protein (DUF1501 family)